MSRMWDRKEPTTYAADERAWFLSGRSCSGPIHPSIAATHALMARNTLNHETSETVRRDCRVYLIKMLAGYGIQTEFGATLIDLAETLETLAGERTARVA